MLQTLTAPRGMVTAPHHLAAEAGLSVLRDGGNAIEAVVAAGATIAVVYPHMNSIGGDAFWLISEPGKLLVGIDACGRAARLATPAFYRERGYSTIPSRGPLAANTVAGAISGWQAALVLGGGKLPLTRLLQDAIWYAAHGTPATANQIAYTSRFFDELSPQPGFANTFLNGGELPRAQAPRRYPQLASTLEHLATRGLDDFYRGEVASAIANELARLGSPVRLSDLAAHRASIVKPLSVKLKVGTAYNLPPPTQGLASLMILAIFERLNCNEPDGFDHVHGVVEATKRAFLVRNRYICDPESISIDVADFLSEDSLARHAGAIDRERAQAWPGPSVSGDTVWLGAADETGRMVSYIQSVYWEFGSGVVLDALGGTWQNRGSSFSLDPASHLALAPGRKPFHTLNPACARLNDGRTIVYGNMGGDGQPQSQAAIFTRYAMFGQDLQHAITAPRWLLGRTWGQASVTLKLESRLGSEVIDALARSGHAVEVLEPYSDLVGHAGALVLYPDGMIAGAADPRSDGTIAGF